MRRGTHTWIEALLVAGAALLLHTPGVGWGLPSAHGWAPDELSPATVLDHPASGLPAGWTGQSASFHRALLGALYRPVLWAHGLDTTRTPPGDVDHLLFLIGRGLSLLMAAGTVALVYDCARRLIGARGAIFSALLTGTLLPLGFYARLATGDVPSLFWGMLSLGFALAALERRQRGALAGFAVAAVLAVATNGRAGGLYVLAAPLLLSACIRRRDGAGRDIVVAAAAAAVMLALVCDLPRNWSGFAAHARLIGGPLSAGDPPFPATPAGQWFRARQSGVNLAFVLGLPALAVCLLGVGSALARRLAVRRRDGDRNDAPGVELLLLPAVSYYATVLAFMPGSSDRLLLPVAVLLTLFGGQVLSEAVAWPGWQGRLGRLATLVVLGYGVARCVSLDLLLLHDARYAAERFLAAQVGTAERVAGIGALPLLPRLDGLRSTTLPPSIDTLAATRPEWLVVNADVARRAAGASREARFYERLRRGELGYRRVYAGRWRARFLFFDSERLQAGAYGPVQSSLARVNPEIEIYRCE